MVKTKNIIVNALIIYRYSVVPSPRYTPISSGYLVGLASGFFRQQI